MTKLSRRSFATAAFTLGLFATLTPATAATRVIFENADTDVDAKTPVDDSYQTARRGRGRGADDAPGHVRGGGRGRGADDAPGHVRGGGRGRGADDGPNHG